MRSKLNIINLIFFISLLSHQHNLNYSVCSFILLFIFPSLFHFCWGFFSSNFSTFLFCPCWTFLAIKGMVRM